MCLLRISSVLKCWSSTFVASNCEQQLHRRNIRYQLSQQEAAKAEINFEHTWERFSFLLIDYNHFCPVSRFTSALGLLSDKYSVFVVYCWFVTFLKHLWPFKTDKESHTVPGKTWLSCDGGSADDPDPCEEAEAGLQQEKYPGGASRGRTNTLDLRPRRVGSLRSV